MNRRIYMPPMRGGNRRVNMHGVLLLYQLIDRMYALNVKPPVTIALIIVNLAIFALPMIRGFIPPEMRSIADFIQRWMTPQRVCLNPQRVLAGERWRLLLSSFVHISDLHVLYNCSSLLYKGVTLESSIGSEYFFALVVYLSFAAHVLYVAIAVAARELGITASLMGRCVVGFSGVLFGLKVVLNSDRRYGAEASRIFGVTIPGGRAPWAELLLAQLLLPNVSFLGHLSGILAGLIYVYIPRLISRRLSTQSHRD